MKIDPKQKEDSFGGCYAAWAVPDLEPLAKQAPILSFMFTFEDALKLKVSLDDAVHWLNRVDRSKAEGKRAALKLNIRLSDGRFYSMRGMMPGESTRLTRQEPAPEEGE